jgi:hypothetical protein
MTEADYLRATRAAYDTVAVDYAARLRDAQAGVVGSSHWRAVPLDAAVMIFETHDVIEFSGACLEDDRVLERGHAVPSTRTEMDCLAGEQLERLQRSVGITHLEEESARLHRDGLLLLLVILQRERVPFLDVQRLPAIATVDEREMFFVSPRLFDSNDGGYP